MKASRPFLVFIIGLPILLYFLAILGYKLTKHEEYEACMGRRTGAICRDGTRSNATGRGACSWHGGVARWLYTEMRTREIRDTLLSKHEHLLRRLGRWSAACSCVTLVFVYRRQIHEFREGAFYLIEGEGGISVRTLELGEGRQYLFRKAGEPTIVLEETPQRWVVGKVVMTIIRHQ